MVQIILIWGHGMLGWIAGLDDAKKKGLIICDRLSCASANAAFAYMRSPRYCTRRR